MTDIRLDRRAMLAGLATAAAAVPALAQATRTLPPLPAGAALATDAGYWSAVRGLYSVSPSIINLENGYWGIMAEPVRRTFIAATDMVNRENSVYARTGFGKDMEAARVKLAAAVGADPAAIAFTRGATEALQLLISNYNRLKPGDQVLYADLDYDSMQYAMAWLKDRRGVEAVKFAIPEPGTRAAVLATYEKILADNPRARLQLLTHVSHRTGLVIPVAEISALAKARGVDVIVIVPFNATVLTNTIKEAKKAGIKVLSYDRLILNADVDAYISFDNEKVGEMQAEGILKVKNKGNFFLLGSSPTDNNAKMFREGQMKALKPYIDKGDIKIVGQQWVKEWNPTEALSIVENALTANNNKIDAIVASNDGTAGGAIQALAAQKLAGKVPVSGQDADLAAVKRVVAGTQTMTVYKPLKQIATEAANLSVQLARNEKPTYNAQYDNGFKKVDSLLLKPILLTKENVKVLVDDGFYTQAQIDGR